MADRFDELLFNTSLDLNLSLINRDDPRQLVVTTRLGLPRIFFGLLFGIPCLSLFLYAFAHQGVHLLIALVLCPPLAILAILFGLTKQSKTFIPGTGRAMKSVDLLGMQRHREVPLPQSGVLLTYKQWSSGGGKSSGCYFYHLEVQGVKGLGFCIARDEQKRDDFAQELARFLNFEIRDQGERHRGLPG